MKSLLFFIITLCIISKATSQGSDIKAFRYISVYPLINQNGISEQLKDTICVYSVGKTRLLKLPYFYTNFAESDSLPKRPIIKYEYFAYRIGEPTGYLFKTIPNIPNSWQTLDSLIQLKTFLEESDSFYYKFQQFNYFLIRSSKNYSKNLTSNEYKFSWKKDSLRTGKLTLTFSGDKDYPPFSLSPHLDSIMSLHLIKIDIQFDPFVLPGQSSKNKGVRYIQLVEKIKQSDNDLVKFYLKKFEEVLQTQKISN